jgi:hypothetical protein
MLKMLNPTQLSNDVFVKRTKIILKMGSNKPQEEVKKLTKNKEVSIAVSNKGFLTLPSLA